MCQFWNVRSSHLQAQDSTTIPSYLYRNVSTLLSSLYNILIALSLLGTQQAARVFTPVSCARVCTTAWLVGSCLALIGMVHLPEHLYAWYPWGAITQLSQPILLKSMYIGLTLQSRWRRVDTLAWRLDLPSANKAIGLAGNCICGCFVFVFFCSFEKTTSRGVFSLLLSPPIRTFRNVSDCSFRWTW